MDEGQKFYTATKGISTHGLGPHALRKITGRIYDHKKRRGQPDKEIDR